MKPSDDLTVAVSAADHVARIGFTYRPDPAGTDTWTSCADDALAGRYWEGDCDDLASTALDILCRKFPTIDLTRLFRLCVKSPQCPPGEAYDHMVAGAFVRTGVLAIFGDTFMPATAYVNSPHRIVQYARLSEGVTWRSGQPV